MRSHWVYTTKRNTSCNIGHILKTTDLVTLDHGLVFIETQTGICEEDDIIRLEDDYGRIDTKQYS